jgi:hypothetical protein
LNAAEWLRLGFLMDLAPPVTLVPGSKSTYTRVRITEASSEAQLKAVLCDSACLGRQKVDDKPCRIGDACTLAMPDRAVPDLGRNRVQAPVHLVVIATGDLERYPSFELRHRH